MKSHWRIPDLHLIKLLTVPKLSIRIFHQKTKPINKMKNLFSLLFMCFLSLAVLTSTAQDDKKGSKGGSKGKAKAKVEFEKAE